MTSACYQLIIWNYSCNIYNMRLRSGFIKLSCLIILFVISNQILFAQITPSKTTFDFGEIYDEEASFVDITYTNNTGKTQYLLTIDKPRDVYYLFSDKKILPDSSIVIRYKINTAIKGKFNYTIDIYFSDSPTASTLYLEGDVKKVNSSSLTDCPDFNDKPPSGDLTFSLVVKVIDSITREPIPNAKVYFVERGELVGNYSTNQKGIVIRNLPLGYYFITAEKSPYANNYFEGYLNATRNYVEIEMSYTEINPDMYIEPVEIVSDNEPEDDTSTTDVVTINNIPIDTTPVEIVPAIIPPLTEIPDSILDPGYFNYSNITFILDASSSMNASGKLELLKLSMIELVKILRPEDNVTVLKYAAETDIVLDHTSGDKKDDIISAIKGIKTSGSTAGGDAIKTAYNLNYEKHMHDGNNLIIIITDGVFNKGAKDYDETIKQHYAQYGTRFSVVGIKVTDLIAEHLTGIANLGGGEFISINNVQDAQTKLIQEIRRTSYKGQSSR